MTKLPERSPLRRKPHADPTLIPPTGEQSPSTSPSELPDLASSHDSSSQVHINNSEEETVVGKKRYRLYFTGSRRRRQSLIPRNIRKRFNNSQNNTLRSLPPPDIPLNLFNPCLATHESTERAPAQTDAPIIPAPKEERTTPRGKFPTLRNFS